MRLFIVFIILSIFPSEIGNSSPEETVNTFIPAPQPPVEIVTMTLYSPSEGETDSTPHLTASGFKIDKNNPGRHKIIAVSRDLKRKWKFNTKIKIINAGRYNGVYTVKDVMNKRYKKRIDILVDGNRKPIKLKGVKVIKL